MSNLFGVPLLLGSVAFLTGWLAAKFSAYVGKRAAALDAPAQHGTIRELEASLRIVNKDAETTVKKLVASKQELETLRTSFNDMEQTQQIREEEMECLRLAVKTESKKVVELRRSLTNHAEETIRAKMVARDSETELSVLKAGASVMTDDLSDMFDDVDGPEVDCDELTDRFPALMEESIGESNSDDSESFMSDC